MSVWTLAAKVAKGAGKAALAKAGLDKDKSIEENVKTMSERTDNRDKLPTPQPNFTWWERPCYFISGFGSGFHWKCAFCHFLGYSDDYGEAWRGCPKCGAVFIGDDSFGAWMAKQVTDEWATGRREVWC